VADDRGSAAGLRGGDVPDRQGDVADRSLTERLAGALALAATYVGLAWLVAAHRGLAPEVTLGIAIGTFVGLASLIMEVAIVGRSMRSVERNGMSATLKTFGIRLATVGALGGWFIVQDAVDAEAFCLAYFATFFLYMCWLTWRVYNEPVHYHAAKARNQRVVAAAAEPAAPAVERELVSGGVA